MRVISGECKGRALRAVPGQSTRPTTDKIKESMFNIIGPYFNGGIGLDLYGGSGGLGIEALSRGMDLFIFVDKDIKAIETIRKNIDQCNYSSKAEVYRNDSQRALKALKKRAIQFDIVFLDPPYAKQRIEKDIEMLDQFELLTKDAQIIAEHDGSIVLPEKIGRLYKVKSELFGKTTAISFYKFDAGR
ncbi:16S rRNA (guanine(966)-N(2))-methyltransferase RsmD [Fictibacillus sp. Mic-4]